ncbi:MAG: QcrA and Rieske domain-containing protein [Planctomycetota bacterium]|jgi:Rieske Fe-S protein
MTDSLDRRAFNKRGLAAAAAVFGGVFGVPGLAGVVDPALGGPAGGWSEAGPAGELKQGEPKRFSYEVRAGWERRSETGFLLKTGETIVAFSSRCTHLGCKVRFRDGLFRCPCHQGIFDLQGDPLEGPVSEPLVRFDTRVANGKVEVKTA